MAKIRMVERDEKGRYKANTAMTKDDFRKELSRPRYITTLIVILLIVVAFFALRKPVRQASDAVSTIGQIHKVVGYTEGLVDLYGEVSTELRRVQAQNRALQAAIEKSNAKITGLEETLAKQAQNASTQAVKIDSLLTLIEYPSFEVETFEECLEELAKAEVTICYLDEVVVTQAGKIGTLKSMSVTKDMIIYEKNYIIERQEDQLQNFADEMQAIARRNRIRNVIYTAGGIAIGILLF